MANSTVEDLGDYYLIRCDDLTVTLQRKAVLSATDSPLTGLEKTVVALCIALTPKTVDCGVKVPSEVVADIGVGPKITSKMKSGYCMDCDYLASHHRVPEGDVAKYTCERFKDAPLLVDYRSSRVLALEGCSYATTFND